MKYVIKNKQTCNYLISKDLETNNINNALYIISDEDSNFIETYLSLNIIFSFQCEICSYEKELTTIRKNKLKKLNYFL